MRMLVATNYQVASWRSRQAAILIVRVQTGSDE